MKYIWKDYDLESMGFVEAWLDESAVNSTGIDDGWNDFYEYWCNEENTVLNENFWCKVIFEDEKPLAVTAFSLIENKLMIMEVVVDNKLRSKGIGTQLLKELISNGNEIFGKSVESSEAVIFPSNIASKKAFEKAGYVLERIHPDGDALYYVHNKNPNEKQRIKVREKCIT